MSEQEFPREAHIQLMEPELAAAASLDFAELQSDGGAKLKCILQDQGFAIVHKVLDETTVASMEKLFEGDLLGIVDCTAPQSKEAAFLKDPLRKWPTSDDGEFSLGSKFASMWGLPQGTCAWAVRTHPNVKAVYEAIYGTDQLCVGMDNVFFNTSRRPSAEKAPQLTSNLWPHADLNAHLKPEGKYDVYQSVVYLWPAGEETSATVVWPGSHQKPFERLMSMTNARSHFCLLPRPDHPTFVEHARRVPVPRGGMLLWESKTIHQGWPHGPRLAIPVCYEPVSRRSKAALESKVEAVRNGLPTTHWASLGKVHSHAAQAIANGGIPTVQLVHRAHNHCLSPSGAVLPAIMIYL
jgi:hypothetical protein